jgi:hypothetical protein
MIVFVLTYAVLALLGLSLVGSMSAEIREPSAKATQFQSARPASRAVFPPSPGGSMRQASGVLLTLKFGQIRPSAMTREER